MTPILRTTYRDPLSPGQPVRAGAASHSELALDMDGYHRSIEQAHNTGLHGVGIAAGLAVSATADAQELRVSSGVAVDGQGRHIAVVSGGRVEIGANADSPGATPSLTEVKADGVVFSTSGRSGTLCLTIQFRETFDSDAFTLASIYRYNHTPWIQLLDAATFVDDGLRLVLAEVVLGAAADTGKIQSLTPGSRRLASANSGGLTLRAPRGTQAGTVSTVEDGPAAIISSRDKGGLSVDFDQKRLLESGLGFLKIKGDIAATGFVNESMADQVLHSQLVELTRGGYSELHKHIAGNAAYPIDVFTLQGLYSVTTSYQTFHDVAWGARRRVFAFGALSHVEASTSHPDASHDLIIDQVDGAPAPSLPGFSNYFLGDASSLRFRLECRRGVASALTVVFAA